MIQQESGAARTQGVQMRKFAVRHELFGERVLVTVQTNRQNTLFRHDPSTYREYGIEVLSWIRPPGCKANYFHER